jgi:RNA polymerase sigma-70 factor (ECF subfamily)
MKVRAVVNCALRDGGMASLSRFETLALPHMAAAYNLAFFIVRSKEDAEDVVQDAYLRAFRAFDDLRGEDIRPWLLTIVRHAAYAMAKARRRSNLIPLDVNAAEPDGTAWSRDIAAEEPTAEQVMVSAGERALVHAALADLPVAYREVVTLREIEGLGYREIAEITGTVVGTVMSRLARGRKELRARLERLLDRNGTDDR